MGIIWIPLNIVPILFCRSIAKSNTRKKTTYIFVITAVIILAFIDFCLAGAHIRYTCDISLAVCLLGALLLLENNQYSTAEESNANTIVYQLSIWICLVTIAVGTLLIFTNELSVIQYSNPDLFLWIRSLFCYWLYYYFIDREYLPWIPIPFVDKKNNTC